jgi:hypothetical protein
MERSRHSKSMDARSFTSFAGRLATPSLMALARI